AVFIWAPVCAGLLTLQNGTMVHMKCFYTGQASIVLALILMITAVVAFFSKTDHNKIQWVIVAIGIMLISNTYDSTIGIGICKKTTMACNVTALWLRGSGILAIVSGLADVFANGSKSNKLTL
ncbi:MAG: DUF4418 family protein, partial [Syntrophomonas sp.]|nr:DUF4418 family protein [Syntrophomonas sp.]